MTENDRARVDCEIENAENAIRLKHNDLEQKRFFGKKNYFAYNNEKTIELANMTSKMLNDLKED